MKGIYLFDNKQNLIKSISAGLLTENTQEQELGGQITGRAKFPYKDFDEEAEYFGVKEDNNFWLYKIRKKQKESGYITIDGIHIFFDELKGAVVRDIRNQKTSGNFVVEKIISGTGWELKANITERLASKNYYYESALSAFYDAVNTWNFEFIPEILFKDGKIISKKISIYDEISKDFGKWYEYGDKLISVIAESSTDELYTAFLGRGKGIATEDENGEKTGGFSRKIKFDEIEYTNEKDGLKVLKPKGTDYIEIKEATKLYGYPDGTPRIGVVDFDDIEDPKLLADATFEYALKNTRPKLQLRANALETESIELGETVAIIRPDMNIRYKVRVFKIQKDFLKDKVVSFEFGDKIVRSAGERLKSDLYEKRRREEEIDTYIDSLRDEINSSYFNDGAYNYDLKIGNKYNLPSGYYSFDRPIDENPTKVIYMGAGKMLVADKKNSDGSWKWGTMATGEGVVAESIVGILGKFAKVNAENIIVGSDFYNTSIGKEVEKVAADNNVVQIDKNGIMIYQKDGYEYTIDLNEVKDGVADVKKAVIQDKLYNGIKINTQKGFQAVRSDGLVKVEINATEGFSIYNRVDKYKDWQAVLWNDTNGNTSYGGDIRFVNPSTKKHLGAIYRSWGDFVIAHGKDNGFAIVDGQGNAYMQFDRNHYYDPNGVFDINFNSSIGFPMFANADWAKHFGIMRYGDYGPTGVFIGFLNNQNSNGLGAGILITPYGPRAVSQDGTIKILD